MCEKVIIPFIYQSYKSQFRQLLNKELNLEVSASWRNNRCHETGNKN